MKILKIKDEAGQRLDKFLFKYLNEAPAGFVYKMLRKKNITLNGKKAEGKEILLRDDEIKLFLADETLQKFSVKKQLQSFQKTFALDVVYEDANLLLINKPAGILSQKATASDVSINEYCLDYLFHTNAVSRESLTGFTPAVCNRLDRNTSGLIICAKTLTGAQQFSDALKQRTMHKYYQCLVTANINKEQHLQGYLVKNERTNKVTVFSEMPKNTENVSYIETWYRPIQQLDGLTLLEIELITGKPHQIRAHLSSIHAPILGDYKYGNKKINDSYKERFGVSAQLLHAYKLVMPEFTGSLKTLSHKIFVTELPDIFKKIMGEKNADMEQPRPQGLYTGRFNQSNK